MKPSKVKYIRWAYMAVILVLALIFYITEKSGYNLLTLPMVLGVGIAAVIMWIIDIAFWRCTCCGAYLGRAFNPQYCHKCGRELE